MADLLALSARIIDGGVAIGSVTVNRITHELSPIAPGVAMVEAFSHSVVFSTDDGLVVFDTSGAQGGKRVVDAIRGWSKDRFNTLVYTHGHIDHVGGCGAFLADAQTQGSPRPTIAGHENVPRRFDRYNLTNGYNLAINARQFRGLSGRGYGIGGESGTLPADPTARNRTSRTATASRSASAGRIRSAPRQRRNRRPHVGVDSRAQGDLRRRLLHHLAIAGVGQVDFAPAARFDRLGQRRGVKPLPIGRPRVEEPTQPAVVVDVLPSFPAKSQTSRHRRRTRPPRRDDVRRCRASSRSSRCGSPNGIK